MLKNICVVVCTKNRPWSLYLTIESILRNKLLPKKIVIIDSTNKITQVKIDEYLRNIISEAGKKNIYVVYHHDETLSLTQARNYALEYCKDCNIITYLDDDIVLHPEYFYKILYAFDNDKIHGAQGLIINLLVDNCNKKGKILFRIIKALAGTLIPVFPYHISRPLVNTFLRNKYPIFPNFKARIIISEWLSGSNMNYKSEIFYEHGFRFDANLLAFGLGEDLDFSYRLYKAGFKLAMVPEAFLLHKTTIINEERECIDPSTIVMAFGYRLYLLKKHYSKSSNSSVLIRFYIYSLLYIFLFISILFKNIKVLKIYVKCFRIVNKIRQDILNLNITKLNGIISRLKRFRVCYDEEKN
ncbi:MAG: glycosyltransferase [Candidatus Methanomethylicia archaeon]